MFISALVVKVCGMIFVGLLVVYRLRVGLIVFVLLFELVLGGLTHGCSLQLDLFDLLWMVYCDWLFACHDCWMLL